MKRSARRRLRAYFERACGMDGEGVATWPRLVRLLDEEKCIVSRAVVEEI